MGAGSPLHDGNYEATWVQSLATGSGTYKAAIHLGDRILCWLTVERATRYAATLAAVVAAATTDAAIMKQLRNSEGDTQDWLQVVGTVVQRVRAARPEPDHGATAPLVFEPGVSLFTGEPFVHVRLDGKLAWQWSPADARRHLLHVLEVAAGTPDDAVYRRVLAEEVGLDADTAARAVQDLGALRDDTLPGATPG